jgi:hypothetical protein
MTTNNSGNLSVKSRWAIRPLVSEDVYTNREEHLEYLYNAAIDAATRRTMSTVLLGQRRMGKTEIFKRVVNRLFFEQDFIAEYLFGILSRMFRPKFPLPAIVL